MMQPNLPLAPRPLCMAQAQEFWTRSISTPSVSDSKRAAIFDACQQQNKMKNLWRPFFQTPLTGFLIFLSLSLFVFLTLILQTNSVSLDFTLYLKHTCTFTHTHART